MDGFLISFFTIKKATEVGVGIDMLIVVVFDGNINSFLEKLDRRRMIWKRADFFQVAKVTNSHRISVGENNLKFII